MWYHETTESILRSLSAGAGGLSAAEAAARAVLAMLRERNCSSCAELAESVGIRLGHLYPGGWEPCNVVPRRNRAAGRTKQEKEQ